MSNFVVSTEQVINVIVDDNTRLKIVESGWGDCYYVITESGDEPFAGQCKFYTREQIKEQFDIEPNKYF